ncbi:MAG: hypothetical protein HZC28_06640 [Spirochaetes bacterium]|nr:hypothetical protein [Spirochaetota bacterium]
MRYIIALLFILISIVTVAADEADDEAYKALIKQGTELFFAAKLPEAITIFTKASELPGKAPEVWQRGIAYYYNADYAAGRKQFELHRTVNPDDVENAVWHFLCVARNESVAAARAALLPVTDDTRIPMKEIYTLYAGTGYASNIIAAADVPGVSEKDRRRRLCYAHLYTGLYYEAVGDTEKSQYHMLKAANDFSMPHFMGRTAALHVRLRGWLPKDAAR